MRVLHMIHSLNVGGAQALQITWARAARARGLDVTVLSLSRERKAHIGPQLEALGVRVLHEPARRVLDPARLGRVLRLMRTGGFDVVQSHLESANIVAGLAGRLAGLPAIGTLHNVQKKVDARYYSAARSWLEWLALRYGVRRVVAVGEAVAEAHRQSLRGQQVVVIPNAVSPAPPLSPEERQALRQELAGDPGRPLLLAVGRLAEQKGYPDLFAAIAALRTSHPQAMLLVAGGGPLQAELEARVEREGLAGHVRLLGVRPDVPRLLAACDLFVLASLWEGLPVAVLEAFAAGLPVVMTAVGEVPRVVAPGTGLTVPPRAPAELAAAVRSLLDSPEQRRQYGQAARQHVLQHYGPDAWLDRHLELYQAVLRERRA